VVNKKKPQSSPKKLSNVLEVIKECILQGKYVFCEHALERVFERRIDVHVALKILLTGYEEKRRIGLMLSAMCGDMLLEGKQ